MSQKEINLEDVAVKLYYSLHSSENENIISSLLTASLNESKDFMKWFLLNAAGMHGNIDSTKFYATSNITIPELLRGKKGMFHGYQHPDVFLLDSRCEPIWNALKKGKGTSVDLRNMCSVFIELKLTDLSGKDRNKLYKIQRIYLGEM